MQRDTASDPQEIPRFENYVSAAALARSSAIASLISLLVVTYILGSVTATKFCPLGTVFLEEYFISRYALNIKRSPDGF